MNPVPTHSFFRKGDLALLGLILILFSVSLAAKSLYVSSTGNDANEGSECNPILTLHQATTSGPQFQQHLYTRQ